MRLRIGTDAGFIDLRVPGGYSPDVLSDLSREAIRLLAAMHAVCGLTPDEETDDAVVDEPAE